jgi:DNA polymerase III delta prime subunit
MTNDNFLWCEYYRPKTVKACILPEYLKSTFQKYVDSGQIPNLILSGTSGVGKTTVARAMCEETGADYILINGSLESGIDTLRVKIMNYATSVSFTGGRKVIIVDEADNLSAAAQLGFRGVIEEVSENCTFIFTCNQVNRIIDAIHSRCAVINFKLSGEDKSEMAKQFLQLLKTILAAQHVQYDMKVLIELIMKHFPDYRRTINELQRYAVNGNIDVGILSQLGDVQITELVKALKAKNFGTIRQWVGNHSDTDANLLLRNIYDKMSDIVQPQSLPVLVVLLGKYQYQAAFVADQEINLMAFLTEVLVDCEFK